MVELLNSEIIILSKLNPIFVNLVNSLIEEVYILTGTKFYVFSGLRSIEEQQRLYDIGRDDKGNIVGNIVTMAKPGHSWHNYGLACDLVLDANKNKPGLQPSWKEFIDTNDDKINDWTVFGIQAITNDLRWGGTFKNPIDCPHVEWHPGITIAQALETYNETKNLEDVWKLIKVV